RSSSSARPRLSELERARQHARGRAPASAPAAETASGVRAGRIRRDRPPRAARMSVRRRRSCEDQRRACRRARPPAPAARRAAGARTASRARRRRPLLPRPLVIPSRSTRETALIPSRGMEIVSGIGDGLWNAFQMAWEVAWALVLGFLLSAIVQAWVPRERMQRALGRADLRSVTLATGLGAASSSCSYAAVAIAKSMFQKGASLATATAFQFASTNLVFELGIVTWVFLGWHFTVAELVGGLVLIALQWGFLRLFVSRRLEEQARRHAIAAESGHVHGSAGGVRLASLDAWTDVARN